jgi:hypothetical protein
LKNLLVNSFVRELYESFIRIRGVPVTFLSLLLGLVYFYSSSNTTAVQLKVILPWVVILLLAVITLFDASYRLYSKASHQLPRVKQARKPPSAYADAVAVLLLEGSDIYGHESVVSIYYIDEGFEVLIGIGFVLTRQDDGYIQVIVSNQIETAYKEVWQRVCKNDSNVLPKLLVKPSIPKLYTEGAKS